MICAVWKKKKKFLSRLEGSSNQGAILLQGGGAWQSLVLFFGSIPPLPLWASCSGLWWACNVQCTETSVTCCGFNLSVALLPLCFRGCVCACVCVHVCACVCTCVNCLGTAWWTWSTCAWHAAKYLLTSGWWFFLFKAGSNLLGVHLAPACISFARLKMLASRYFSGMSSRLLLSRPY